MRATLLAVALALLAAPSLAAPLPKPIKRDNLLTNGSFEDGPAVDRWLAVNAGSKEIKGWVVTRAQIDVVGSHWKAADGKRSLDLHGSPGKGGVSQTFGTKVGRTYVVTFSFAGNPEGSGVPKVLGVSAAGKETSFTFETKGKTLKDLGWVKKTWKFKAVKDRTTLELWSMTKGEDASCGPVIDNVVVVGED
jgi:choice-of-anchor C domain-containing protein